MKLTVIAKRMDEDYGRFAWVFDPEGNKVELWEPKLYWVNDQ